MDMTSPASLSTWLSLFGLTFSLYSLLACGGDDSASGGDAGGPAGGGGGAGGATPTTSGATSTTSGATSTTSDTDTALPQIGAHGLSYYRSRESSNPTIDSPPLTTQPTGSTLIVSVGRGHFDAFAPPTDNKGNSPYEQLGEAHTYTKWSTSGTAVYAFKNASGGPNHILTNTTPPADEITFAVVEVKGATHIQDFQWVEKLESVGPITSAPVTTTGPATLVAFWWGDGGANDDKVAVPNNGFVVLDSIGLSGSLVQCYVAAKEVDSAGTYDVTWDATPPQGAQLWLVAVQ